MNNRTRYSGGGAPLGQGREGANRGRQRLLFEDEEYDFANNIYYQRRDIGGHDYEARHRAVFQVTTMKTLVSPPMKGEQVDSTRKGSIYPPNPM
jgi:hypothetical protein